MLHACHSMLCNRVLPVSHLNTLNPHVTSALALEEAGRLAPRGCGALRQQGPRGSALPRIPPQGHGECFGVSAFAFQGTNAHLILSAPLVAAHASSGSPIPPSRAGAATLPWSDRESHWVAAKAHGLVQSVLTFMQPFNSPAGLRQRRRISPGTARQLVAFQVRLHHPASTYPPTPLPGAP
jgi:hypothetical protein